MEEFYDFFETGHVDNTCTGQMNSQASLLDTLGNLIAVMIPKERQIKEFNKLLDIMNIDLPTRMIQKAKVDMALSDKNKMSVSKAFKKKFSESVIYTDKLFNDSRNILIYTRNGVVKESTSINSTSDVFLTMTREIQSFKAEHFQFMYDDHEERIVLLVYVGTFIYNKLKIESIPHTILNGLLCFKYYDKGIEDNTLFTADMLYKFGFDITEDELIKMVEDYKKKRK